MTSDIQRTSQKAAQPFNPVEVIIKMFCGKVVKVLPLSEVYDGSSLKKDKNYEKKSEEPDRLQDSHWED